MPYIILPRRMRPKGPLKVNHSNPLAKDLRLLFGIEKLRRPREVVLGVDATAGGKASPNGYRANNAPDSVAARLRGVSTDYYELPHDDSYSVTGDISLLWSGTVDDGFRFHHFIGKHQTNGAGVNPYDFRSNGNTIPEIYLVRADASVAWQWNSLVSISLGAHHQAGVTHVSGAVPANFYLDGTFRANVNNNIGTAATPTADSSVVRVGRRADGTMQSNGYTEFVAIWARILSAYEFAELYRNPWQLVVPDPEVRYFFQMAGSSTQPPRTMHQQRMRRAA